MTTNFAPRRAQRGVVALALCLMLLLLMTGVAFIAHRGLLTDQKISVDNMRSARAAEAAESGLEWATAMLNDPAGVDTHCRPSAGSQSFRSRFSPVADDMSIAPTSNIPLACRIGATGLDCSCAQGAAPSAGAGGDDPAFSVTLAKIDGDPQSIEVVSWGCVGRSTRCSAEAGTSQAVAQSSARVVLKLNALLRSLPTATLTSGGSVHLTGSATLINSDTASSGLVVEALGTVVVDPTATVRTLAGTPVGNALAATDEALVALANGQPVDGPLFDVFFGATDVRFQHALSVQSIEGDSASSRTQALKQAYAAGYSAFYVKGNLDLSGEDIGSSDRPVLIVSDEGASCSSACALHGLLFHRHSVSQSGVGDALNITGAAITTGDHEQAGGSIAYDAALLQRLRAQTSIFVRLPGSWRDF